MYDNDPLLKDWVFFIWQTAIDIEKNDGKILEEVMDDEMQEAYESGTLEQSIPIQAPIIPNTNERYNFEHIY
jgi:hypothetical protein